MVDDKLSPGLDGGSLTSILRRFPLFDDRVWRVGDDVIGVDHLATAVLVEHFVSVSGRNSPLVFSATFRAARLVSSLACPV